MKRCFFILFPELSQLIRKAGLHVVSLPGPSEKFTLSLDNPKLFRDLDEKMKRHLKRLTKEEQFEFAELFDGTLHNHYAYASKMLESEASFKNLENIPYVYGEPKDLSFMMDSAAHMSKLENRNPLQMMFRYALNYKPGPYPVLLEFNTIVARMMKMISEGSGMSTGEIIETLNKETGIKSNELLKICKKFYDQLKITNLILLRSKNVSTYPKTHKRTLFNLSFL